MFFYLLDKKVPKADKAKCQQDDCQWNSMERISSCMAVCDGGFNVTIEAKHMSKWDLYQLSQTGSLSQLERFEKVHKLRFQQRMDLIGMDRM